MNDVVLPVTRPGPEIRRSNPEILHCVEQTEKISSIVPMAIILGLVGLSAIGPLVMGHFVDVIVGSLIMYFIAKAVASVVNSLILKPMRTVRYKGAAKTLASQLQAGPERVTICQSWWMGAPGAIAVTANGHVIICDRSTNYEELWLVPSQIVNVGIEREATQITNIRHGGSFTLGGVSGGIFGGYTFGGRSKATTTVIEDAFLEIRYQFERNSPVYTTVLAFGRERRAAEELCGTLTRLEHLPA
ncbi:hypothetical protein [Sphingomonas sp. PAMC 26605]|uniref:hypothetical protein n=1 Tax=Sphingomonas sp. PAMC 26605 TaxID=1112214 RepID=UPI0006868EB5|nr:hypothetical protein [Sphingomonas sp. PAMC 26605]